MAYDNSKVIGELKMEGRKLQVHVNLTQMTKNNHFNVDIYFKQNSSSQNFIQTANLVG